jgi:hypothetical protein
MSSFKKVLIVAGLAVVALAGSFAVTPPAQARAAIQCVVIGKTYSFVRGMPVAHNVYDCYQVY